MLKRFYLACMQIHVSKTKICERNEEKKSFGSFYEYQNLHKVSFSMESFYVSCMADLCTFQIKTHKKLSNEKWNKNIHRWCAGADVLWGRNSKTLSHILLFIYSR